MDAQGKVVRSTHEHSGNYTLGHNQRNTRSLQNASHTEPKLLKTNADQLRFAEAGSTLIIEGRLPPCTNCKGAMNASKREFPHLNFVYKWTNGKQWTANGGRQFGRAMRAKLAPPSNKRS